MHANRGEAAGIYTPHGGAYRIADRCCRACYIVGIIYGYTVEMTGFIGYWMACMYVGLAIIMAMSMVSLVSIRLSRV